MIWIGAIFTATDGPSLRLYSFLAYPVFGFLQLVFLERTEQMRRYTIDYPLEEFRQLGMRRPPNFTISELFECWLGISKGP